VPAKIILLGQTDDIADKFFAGIVAGVCFAGHYDLYRAFFIQQDAA
jgi:hypothetical protein